LFRQSPLHNIHRKLKAKFTKFAGFEMPLQFSSIKDEHLQVRQTVGLFDVSHMSNVWITGKDAEDLITLTTIEDASRIGENKSQYTAILREDGTIIDDTIFMHLDEKYMIALSWMNYGIIYRNKKEWAPARYNFEKSIALLDDLNMPYYLADCKRQFGLMLADQSTESALNESRIQLRESLKIYESIGAKKFIDVVRAELDGLKTQ